MRCRHQHCLSTPLKFEALEARELLAAASLLDWVGIGNVGGANNYVVTSATSAGGTFAERRATAASLTDHTLVGGTFDWNSQLSMSGTVQFTGGFDPVFFLGWYDSTNLNERIGIGAANPSPVGGGIRWQTQSGNTAGTGIVNQNFTNNTTTSTLPPGTYAFTFNYNGAGNMSGTFGTINFSRNYAQPSNQNLNMDRFGFLQKASTDDDAHFFTVNISDINYTGEIQYTPPAPTLPGDYNDDDTVNAADYVVWRKTLGTDAGLPNDSSPPGVGTADYTVWQDNFGEIESTPTAPTSLAAISALSQISLTWSDNSNNETGFIVERRIGISGAFMELTTVAANVTSFTDTGLAANTTFEYQVRAVNGAGDSVPSNIAGDTTPQVTVSAVEYSRIQIYHGSQAENYVAGDPSWTSWVGAWIMPNGDLMVGVTQASGREQPFHNNPSPYSYAELDIDVVYLRSSNGGATWTKVVESDVSFTTAPDSGLGTHASNSAATIALSDGSLIRRVYGWDYQEFPDMPGTAFMQRSTDGGLTWSPAPVSSDGGLTWSDPSPIQECFLNPARYTVQPTRMLRLSDGRLLMAGSVWNGPNTQSAPHEPLLMVSADEAVSWQRVNFAGPGWNASYTGKFANEWDVEELPGGDLIVLSRVQNMPRWQAIFAKTGGGWEVQSAGETTIPHSGHPELLATQQGPVLSIATTGTVWSNDFGNTWLPLRVDSLPDLAGGDYRSMYYPDSLQTADGWIYVFSHRPSPGGDDNYGGANQAVFMDKFRLVAVAAPGSGGAVAGRTDSHDLLSAGAEEPSAAPLLTPTALATMDPGGSDRSAVAKNNLTNRASSPAAIGARGDAIRFYSLLDDLLLAPASAQTQSIDEALTDEDRWSTWIDSELDRALGLLSEREEFAAR
jgi:hypothetical protein